ncbi:unnamed protein product [Pylaiella littoralis]
MVTASLTTALLVISLPPALLFLLARRSKRRAAYLPGKIVWITGASSGLGEQLAISAAAGGAAGLILSGRREDALDRVKKACEETAATCNKGSSKREGGVRVEVLPFDVADLEFAEREAAARAVQLFGSVDALVLNAGISTRGSVEETPLEVDKRVMAVNYFGPVALAKGLMRVSPQFSRSPPPPTTTAAAAATKTTTGPPSSAGVRAGAKSGSEWEGGVRFVVINSVQGKFGMAFRSSYAASKHALVGFFDCFRAEHAHRGIGVLNVFPGYVRTSLSVNALTADGTKHAQMDATTAKGRDPREASNHFFKVADEIWQSVAERKDEVVIADLKTNVAVLLRALAPRTLFGIMAKRALKADAGGAH